METDRLAVAGEHVEGTIDGVVLDQLDLIEREPGSFGDVFDRDPEVLPSLPQPSRGTEHLTDLLDTPTGPGAHVLLGGDISLEVVDLLVLVHVGQRRTPVNVHEIANPSAAARPAPARNQASSTLADRLEQAGDPLGGILLHALGHVRVDVHGDLDAGVAELLLDDLGVHPRLQGE